MVKIAFWDTGADTLGSLALAQEEPCKKFDVVEMRRQPFLV